MRHRLLLAAGILAVSSTHALSPPPPLPEDVLADFYEAMNGDDWHRNDGWLDPEVDVCDWYGITCVTEGIEFGGFEWVGYIRLPNNNLRGELSAELIDRMDNTGPSPTPSRELDLSGNEISGALPRLPLSTPRIHLRNNELSGPLPPIEPEAVTDALEYLDLGSNRFTGEVPESWEQLALIQLDLSTNLLQGSTTAALRALDPVEAGLIDLSDNGFSGELPAWITDLPLPADPNVGSIDICWTGLEIADQDVAEWVSERHVGGPDYDQCLLRSRRALGPEVSGSWYEPGRSGEGYSVMLLDNGVALTYWFTHMSRSRQMWLIGTGRHGESTLHFHDLLRTEGAFNQGHGAAEEPVSRKGELRMDGVADDRLHLTSRINYLTSELAQPDSGPIVFMPNPIDFRTDLVRLSELAGTTCDNQSDFQQYSGAWYNPERAGEGFIVEVLPDDRVVVYWFTYEPAPSNDPAWMIGQGDIGPGQYTCLAVGCEPPDADLVIEEMLRPIDTAQTFPADLTGVEDLDWGEVRITFNDGIGYVYFDSTDEAFGTGDYVIERLARPMLAECE
jgi:hypothetical protein